MTDERKEVSSVLDVCMYVRIVFVSEAGETEDQPDINLLGENENVGFIIQKSDSVAGLENCALF